MVQRRTPERSNEVPNSRRFAVSPVVDDWNSPESSFRYASYIVDMNMYGYGTTLAGRAKVNNVFGWPEQNYTARSAPYDTSIPQSGRVETQFSMPAFKRAGFFASLGVTESVGYLSVSYGIDGMQTERIAYDISTSGSFYLSDIASTSFTSAYPLSADTDPQGLLHWAIPIGGNDINSKEFAPDWGTHTRTMYLEWQMDNQVSGSANFNVQARGVSPEYSMLFEQSSFRP
jgi:hypothetical protein